MNKFYKCDKNIIKKKDLLLLCGHYSINSSSLSDLLSLNLIELS